MSTRIKYTLRWGSHAFNHLSFSLPCMHVLVSCKCLVFFEDKERSFLLVWQFCFWLLGLSRLLPYQTVLWLELEKFVFSEGLDKARQSHHLSTDFRTRSQGSAEISSGPSFGIVKSVRLLLRSEECSAVTFSRNHQSFSRVFGCCGVNIV